MHGNLIVASRVNVSSTILIGRKHLQTWLTCARKTVLSFLHVPRLAGRNTEQQGVRLGAALLLLQMGGSIIKISQRRTLWRRLTLRRPSRSGNLAQIAALATYIFTVLNDEPFTYSRGTQNARWQQSRCQMAEYVCI